MSEHTPTPWDLCHHLQSAEKDASCQCGYRGGIWGNKGGLLVCEMRNCDLHEGHDMTPVGSRAEQLANAAFICKAVNNHEMLVKALESIQREAATKPSGGAWAAGIATLCLATLSDIPAAVGSNEVSQTEHRGSTKG